MLRLDAGQMYRLTQFVDKEYVKSEMTDGEFILHASAELGFEVGRSSLVTARGTLGLENNTTRSKEGMKGDDGMTKLDAMNILNELATLQSLIREQAKRIDTYFNVGRG